MNIVVCHLINIICCSVLQCVAVCCSVLSHTIPPNENQQFDMFTHVNPLPRQPHTMTITHSTPPFPRAYTPPLTNDALHVVLHSLPEWHQYYCPPPRTTPSQQTPKQEEGGEGTRRRIVTSPRECTNETSYKRIVTSPPLNPTVSVKERAAQVCIRP